MANPEQIEQEMREFLAMEDSISKGDRLSYLMVIVNKHFALDQISHVVMKHDFDQMISNAKGEWASAKMPIRISKRDVGSMDVNYVLVMEALIGYLNRNKLLKKLVKFDYTER